MSPEPEVRSHREPRRSVSLRGVVPWVAMLPFRSASFLRMAFSIAERSSSPLRAAKSLSARYLSFSSLGRPLRPSVKPGDTTGSASSHILPTGSLKAPSPYTIASILLPVAAQRRALMASATSWALLGKSFTTPSVALFEPRRPYFSL